MATFWKLNSFYVFHCITSLGTEPYAQRLREENLKNVFGKTVFERVHCIECGADKTEALKRYEDSDFIWVEDKPQNAEAGARLGLRSFLINRNYNEDYCLTEDVTRINNWKELYDYVS